MSATLTIFKREFASFFATPVAYIFILIFLVMSGVFTFLFGEFYERGQADLLSFFDFHPWLYLFLVPAIAMRTWSEERKSGSIELIMTLPITTMQIMLGKFFAAWAILGLCLLMTFPLFVTVNYLGAPDNGVILAAYLGSWLMSGAFLAVGICMSATTRNQVVAFISAIVICFVFVLAGSPVVIDLFQMWAPNIIVDAIAGLSFLTHFQNMAKGVIVLNDVLFYVLSIAVWLFAAYVVIEQKKAH
ncbi:ABC-2 type transport system permease protein [Glaciecola punicea ACAM 611]|jgi:ABC-2 type transport system permease protein|uniref:ABC-2 type transport system permease protein n=1 Tax=Glaciecola punicea ACAM 611 TaxID=1121923 RepID=H5T7Z2_9ALTE|nr:ABC transporter permease subunit [Glaciecola punicea]GAB54419.1 ABC-2 type transport system permease protein [Glaciecola punicea ACAM 611]